MEIYIEYAFMENFLYDLALLWLAFKAARIKTRAWKLLVSSAIGGVFAVAFPLLSSSFAVLLSVCAGALIMKMFGQTRFNVLLLVAVTVCAYVIFSLKTKLVSSEDIMMIPNGDKILRLLRAARLIK